LILYVEDGVLMQESIQTALTEAGYGVLVVSSGREGLAALESRGSDLRGLVTDIDPSSGVDGWEVARQARELIRGLPVVYVSGASRQEWTSIGIPRAS